jgi:hypothetical protein
MYTVRRQLLQHGGWISVTNYEGREIARVTIEANGTLGKCKMPFGLAPHAGIVGQRLPGS